MQSPLIQVVLYKCGRIQKQEKEKSYSLKTSSSSVPWIVSMTLRTRS